MPIDGSFNDAQIFLLRFHYGTSVDAAGRPVLDLLPQLLAMRSHLLESVAVLLAQIAIHNQLHRFRQNKIRRSQYPPTEISRQVISSRSFAKTATPPRYLWSRPMHRRSLPVLLLVGSSTRFITHISIRTCRDAISRRESLRRSVERSTIDLPGKMLTCFLQLRQQADHRASVRRDGNSWDGRAQPRRDGRLSSLTATAADRAAAFGASAARLRSTIDAPNGATIRIRPRPSAPMRGLRRPVRA